MRNFCGITDEKDIARETERFENMIVEKAQERQAAGLTGMEILPGVHTLITSVSIFLCFSDCSSMPRLNPYGRS